MYDQQFDTQHQEKAPITFKAVGVKVPEKLENMCDGLPLFLKRILRAVYSLIYSSY